MSLFVAAVLLAASSAHAGDLGCKANPGLIGMCYWLRATINIPFGSADAVIWPDNGSPNMPVVPAPGSKIDMPHRLSEIWNRAVERTGDVDVQMHGTFDVCPVPARFDKYGRTKFVCVEAWRKLSFRGFRQ